ncbi:MAG: response regulator transcription factor [Pseudomonadota bacterium]
MTIRVVIVDDHQLVRSGLVGQLEGVDGIEVIAAIGSAEELLDKLESTAPDVLLQDLSLGEADSIALAADLMRRFPDLRVIAVTMHKERVWLERALSAGFNGYVLKDDAFEDLDYAIRSVARGGRFVSPTMLSQHADTVLGGGSTNPALELTDRERDVLTLVADGLNSREVGQQLHISAKTVESHRARISEKLGFRNVADYTKFALRNGWISI